MSRGTRYEKFTVEHQRTVEQLICNGGGCGVMEDIEPLSRPEGWFTVIWNEGGATKTRDFHDFGCLYGWAEARSEDGPSDLLDTLEASVEAVRARKELV